VLIIIYPREAKMYWNEMTLSLSVSILWNLVISMMSSIFGTRDFQLPEAILFLVNSVM
jgi:hypothetical protein